MSGLQTSRLILRQWKESDIESFAAMNLDPQVMEFYPRTFTIEQTMEMVKNMETNFKKDKFGLWALEIKATGEFIGYVGLGCPQFKAHFTPCVEIGWRIARKCWGNGLVPEAAKEAIRDGFERLNLPEIVSLTAAINKRSIRVMEKIGMKRNPDDDFLHPLIEDGHPLNWTLAKV